MERRFQIWTKSTGDIEATIVSENPKTAETIWSALPIQGSVNRWGDEVYFSVPIDLNEEKARAEVEVGSIAYWPPGRAICIFFGATPASKHGEPRAYSPVNVFARVVGNPSLFNSVNDGEKVLLKKSK